jgi:NAD-dependent deacetylase
LPKETSVSEARALLASASKVAVLTGAGISAESGVPTFRGLAGLWREFRPEDLATPEAFAGDPKLCWEWYDWRRGLIANVQPNPGHTALVDLESSVPSFTLITQNVDGLHQGAGSKNVVELHGSIWTLRCTKCSNTWQDFSPSLKLPPYCSCGTMARPGVVWFGENLDPLVWHTAEQSVRHCDVVLVVGTSAVVYPAAGLAGLAAKVIEINLEPTPLSATVDVSLVGSSGVLLPQLIDRLK